MFSSAKKKAGFRYGFTRRTVTLAWFKREIPTLRTINDQHDMNGLRYCMAHASAGLIISEETAFGQLVSPAAERRNNVSHGREPVVFDWHLD